ncbi:lipoxygenase family protein [Thiocapsa marina]|uniref:Arachidonate 15-lipoxygenase n=1 Tax=Thiocapsa marina 5811 TaxID=768671 RepID=F9U5X3_9GAMM|nr:lipoxygenase family protein [Thiocapsa marina]EGV20546.1 Arachidonate 15-lipoxygenase [Thiocapsa marina 5811]
MIDAIRDYGFLYWERFLRSRFFMVLLRPIIITLITLNSIVTRQRMSHENGLVVRGQARILADVDLPPNGFFTPGKVFPCRLRHASVSFLDDAALVVRGASVKFADEAVESPFDMLMNNGNSTPFWNMDTFFQFTLARIRGGRAHLIGYFKRHPRCYMNVRDALRRDPSSFANLYYYSQIPLRFIAEDAVERYAKFRLIPWDETPERDGIPDEGDLQTPWFQEAQPNERRGRNYLKDAYRRRLDKQHVRYRFQIQLLEWRDSDDRDYELSSLYPWNEDDCPWRDLAEVTITEALEDTEGNECLFSLRHLPQTVLQTIPARCFRDGPSIDYLRLAGWWPRRARLLMYRLRGQPPRIPDERSEPADAYADETVSSVVSDDVYRRPCLPQHDTPERREERREQLEKARGVYQYLHGYIQVEPTGERPPWEPPPWYRRVFKIYEPEPEDRKTVPVPLPPFVRELPKADRYSRYIQGRIYRIVGVSYLALALSRIENWLAKRNGLDIYRFLLWGFRDKPPTMARWREDAEFARQRVAGVNPRMLRRFTEIPANFPVTDATLAGLLDADETLASAIEKKRLYWCNYAVLEGISVKPGRYLAHPIALFYVNGEGRLMPVAIQLFQRPEAGPIFTPKDDPGLWLAVKTFTQSADAQVHEVVEHLLSTHLIVELFKVAMRRTLPDAHPVNKLLTPHLAYTMAVNTSARTQLLAPGGPIDSTMAVGSKGAFELMARAWRDHPILDGQDVPLDLKARGVDDVEALPDYPWRDDALKLWTIVRGYVAAMVAHFYASDDDVVNDDELQAFHAEIRDPRGGNIPDMPGRDAGFRSRDELSGFLTRIVYTATAGHAAVNNGQYDCFGFIPNVPGALYRPPPRDKDLSWSERDLERALPDLRTASTQILMVRLLSRRTEMPIGRYAPAFFAGTQSVLPIVTRFRRDLHALSLEIEGRNRSRDVPYTYLDPKQVPQSIVT